MFKNIQEKIKLRKYKKQLIKKFLIEHKKYIPKYSPEGLKLEWDIYVYKDGIHDVFTGKFLGEYKVGIKQKPPKFLSMNNRIYEYDIHTKQLKTTDGWWQ